MTSGDVFTFTYMAAADLSTKRYHGMRISAEMTVNTSGAAAEDTIGVLINEPSAAGMAASVRILGTAEVMAGAAFAAGARLTTNAAGRWITATTGQAYHAIASHAATADGDVVEALLLRGRVP